MSKLDLFFSYDPEDGISFHATEDEARSEAEGALEAERDNAADSDLGWNEQVSEICWGVVLGDVVQTKCEQVEDGEIWDFALKPIAPADLPPAALTESHRELLAACEAAIPFVTDEHFRHGMNVLAQLRAAIDHARKVSQ